MVEVHKFGGSLLKDPEGVKQVAEVIARLKRPAVVVVSAMFNITNVLEKVYDLFRTGSVRKANDLLNVVLDNHQKVALEFNIPTDKMYDLIQSIANRKDKLSYADVVSIGEKLSSYLLKNVLESMGLAGVEYVPAQSFMVTSDHQYGATPYFEEIVRRFPKPKPGQIILTEGFIGVDRKGYSTTLGREGSDFTATILGSVVGSRRITLWKNVNGIYNADPVEFKGARIFQNLNVNEAIEMTFFGARVLHPRTFTPLENKNAKLIIRAPYSDEYTTVSEEPTNPQLPVFILHKNIRLITCYLRQPDLMDALDYARIYQLSAEHRVPIKLLQKGARSLSIVVPEKVPNLSAFMEALRDLYNVRFNDDLFLLTVRHLKHNINNFIKGEVILSEITRQTQHYLMTEWQPLDISAFE